MDVRPLVDLSLRSVTIVVILQSMVHLDKYIYLFGGTTGFMYSNAMHRLDLNTLEWELICSPTGTDIAPSRR